MGEVELAGFERKAKSEKETWCFFGDSGVPGLAQQNVSNLLVKANRSCDRVYHLGDIVYPTGITSGKDPALRTNFLQYQAPFHVPFSFVLGDHEYYGLNIDPWIEVAKAHKNLYFPSYFYGHNIGGVCVIAADTTPFYRGRHDDPKPKEQIEWFEKEVPKYLRDCSFKIFIAHHSYDSLNTERKPPKDDYKEPLRKFFENNVLGKFDIIFTGHDHALAFVGNFKGTDHYISGAGGKYTKDSDDRMDCSRSFCTC